MEPVSLGLLITGIVSAITSIVGGITNAVGTANINQQQKDIMYESWEKQSIPYRMAELEKAGLNKQLATGMNPNYSVSARLETPDFGSAISSGPGKILDTLSAIVGSESAIQQTKNAKQAYELGETNKLIAEERLAQERETTRLLKHDIAIKVGRPYASDEPSSFGLNLRTFSGLLDMLGIGTGDPNRVGAVPTAVKAIKTIAQTIDTEMKKKAEQKKRVDNAWRSDSNSQAAIKYSHGAR